MKISNGIPYVLIISMLFKNSYRNLIKLKEEII